MMWLGFGVGVGGGLYKHWNEIKFARNSRFNAVHLLGWP